MTNRVDRAEPGPVPGSPVSVRVWDGGQRWRQDATRDLLIERDAELDLLRELVGGLGEARPAVVAVEGAPGTGRTALLRRVGAFAEERGFRVVAAQGSPAEANLRYGVVSQLLGSIVPIDCPLWTRETWTNPELDAQLVPLLCRDFLSVARKRPLLVVVDDAHLADPYSARWLMAMDRRLRDLPLMILVAANVGSAPVGGVADRDRDPATGTNAAARHLLRLAPLSVDGVRAVLAAGAPEPVDEEFARAALRVTGGNPGLLHAVLRRVGPRGRAADLRTAADAALGDRVASLVAALPDELAALLRALAACGPCLDFELVCALAGLRTVSEHAALTLLVGMGFVRSSERPQLVDATTGERILEAMPPAEREDLHARAAELGHRAAIPDEDLAEILLGARPVGAAWAVDVLRRAAEQAGSGTRPQDAVGFLERALREPLGAGERARLLVELGAAQPPSAAVASDRYLTQVMAGPADPETDEFRLRAADLLLTGGRAELAYRHLAAALSVVQPCPDAKYAALIALYLLADVECQGEPAGLAEPDAPELVPLTDEPTEPALAGVAAARYAARGQNLVRAKELAHFAVYGDGHSVVPLAPRIAAARALSVTDDVDEALAAADLLMADARRWGPASVHAVVLALRAEFGLRAGYFADAERDLSAALRRLPLADWHPTLAPGAVATQALLYLERGEVELAERTLDAFTRPRLSTAGPDGAAWCRLLFARGRVRLVTGDVAAAVVDLVECGRRLLARHEVNPALLPWRSLAALAHQATGDVAEAARLVAEERELAVGWGALSAVRLATTVTALVAGGVAPDRLASAVLVDAAITMPDGVRDRPRRSTPHGHLAAVRSGEPVRHYRPPSNAQGSDRR